MESDSVRHDRIHHHQHGWNYRPDHRSAEWIYPSRSFHCVQLNASLRCCKSCNLLDAFPELRWINQEIFHLRFDLLVPQPNWRSELIRQSWDGQVVML